MQSSWIFWTSGILLGASALWLLYYSLLADRAKGRKRCPKCWYDMQLIEGFRCPECGNIIKRQRKLFKTRRKWRWAAVSLALLLAGLGLCLTPKIKSDGWAWMVPTTGLIIIQRYREDTWAYDEILDRIRVLHGEDKATFPRSKLTDANWKRLGTTCVQTLRDSEERETLDFAMYFLGKVANSEVDPPDGVCQVLAKWIEHSEVWAADILRRQFRDPEFRKWLGDDYSIIRDAVLARLKQTNIKNEVYQLLGTFSHSVKPETVLVDLLSVIPEMKSDNSIRIVFELIIGLYFKSTDEGWNLPEIAIDHLVSILSCEYSYARSEAELLLIAPGLLEQQVCLATLHKVIDENDPNSDKEKLGRVLLLIETLVNEKAYEKILIDEPGTELLFIRTATSIDFEFAYFLIRRNFEGKRPGDMDNTLGRLIQDKESKTQSLSLLAALAKDDDPKLRALVPAFVIELGDGAQEALPILEDLRLDSNETVRRNAEEAIKQIHESEVEAP